MFEQSPTFAKAGALLGVSVNAQNAIQAINPSLMEQIDSVVVKSGKSFAYNHTGTSAVVGSLEAHYITHPRMIAVHSWGLTEVVVHLAFVCQRSTALFIVYVVVVSAQSRWSRGSDCIVACASRQACPASTLCSIWGTNSGAPNWAQESL